MLVTADCRYQWVKSRSINDIALCIPVFLYSKHYCCCPWYRKNNYLIWRTMRAIRWSLFRAHEILRYKLVTICHLLAAMHIQENRYSATVLSPRIAKRNIGWWEDRIGHTTNIIGRRIQGMKNSVISDRRDIKRDLYLAKRVSRVLNMDMN